MTLVNRMDDPIVPTTPDEINFLDPEVQECPYPAYSLLREEAPVWRDPLTGMYNVTRYSDLRKVLLDTEDFGNERPRGSDQIEPERARKITALYKEKGWLPAPTLAGRDDPNHKQMRSMFDHAFRASRVKQLDPFVQGVAYRLVDAFIDKGECEWVRAWPSPCR